jgi:hypothetical protein
MKYTLLVHDDLYHSSLLISALAAFRSDNCEVAIETKTWVTQYVPRLVGDGRTLAFDLKDQSHWVCLNTLERADIYFKRSYYEPDLAGVPGALRRKIRPMGLNFAFRTTGSTALIARMLGRQPTSGWRFRTALQKYVRLARASDFERPPDASAERVIYFQTRVWEPSDAVGDEAVELNEVRVGVVRLLRKEFGTRFRGGLVPSPLAKRRYPDAITTEPHVRSAFARSSRSALVGVYTRGLFHSLAFKLPEYLAASKCIVSEPLRNRLPVSLQADLNLLQFNTIQDCVGLCDRLLSDSRLCREMQAANWDYYQRHVRFDRRIPLWLSAFDSGDCGKVHGVVG